MARLILFLTLLLIIPCFLFGQDEITFRTGDILKAKILEVGTEEIIYKKFENLTGPSYTVKKNQVFMIKYENGDKDVFGTDKASDPAPNAVVPSSGAPAIIYFYRPGKFVGSSPEIIVGTFVPDEVIVKLRNNHWYKAEYFYTGQREFITGVYAINGAKLSVNIEGGKTYYIRCSLMKGMGVQSQLEIVNEETGRKEMTSLKQQERAK